LNYGDLKKTWLEVDELTGSRYRYLMPITRSFSLFATISATTRTWRIWWKSVSSLSIYLNWKEIHLYIYPRSIRFGLVDPVSTSRQPSSHNLKKMWFWGAQNFAYDGKVYKLLITSWIRWISCCASKLRGCRTWLVGLRLNKDLLTGSLARLKSALLKATPVQ
jgi:hypothetical protein